MSNNDLKIGSLIPQLGYDIIARFMPGIFIIFLFVITIVGSFSKFNNTLLDNINQFNFWFFILLLVFSYVISIILFGISLFYKKLVKIIISKSKKNVPDVLENTDTIKGDKVSQAYKYDSIRVKSKDAGGRLLKLRAEGHSAQISITGLVLCFILNIYMMINTISIFRIFLAITIFLSIIGLFSFLYYIKKRYVVNLENHWKILKEK